MVLVQRANVILEIEDEKVDRFLDDGYSVIDAKGNVIRESVPRDINQLQLAYNQHIQEIEKLKAEIEDLQKKLKAKTTQQKKQ